MSSPYVANAVDHDLFFGSGSIRKVGFFFSSRRRHTRSLCDWSSDVCSSDLHRVGTDPIVLGTTEPMIKTGASRQELHLFGANLPSSPSPTDVNFGPGVTVDRIVSATPTQMTVSVSVAADATLGRRNVIVAGATGEASIAVYNTIDFIKVRPQSGLSRLGGGTAFPKQLQQFEAIGYAKGPDGKADTKDDVELGLLDVSWSIEEYA